MDDGALLDPGAPGEPDLRSDLLVHREANVETREGRFITVVVHRVWQTDDGTPLALVVGDATIPWPAVLVIRPATPAPTYEDVSEPVNPLGPGLTEAPGIATTAGPGPVGPVTGPVTGG